MQLRTAIALGALAFGCPSLAHAATKVPVEIHLLDLGVLQFENNLGGQPLVAPQIVTGPVLDWSVPTSFGSGSGHFEVVVGGGRFDIVTSGGISSGVLQQNYGFDVRFVSKVPLKIGFVVPDFGESMTTIAFVKKRLGDVPSGQGSEVKSDVSIRGGVHFSSSLLSTEMHLTGVFIVSSGRRPYSSEPDVFEGGELVSLVSGDEVTLDAFVEATAQCAPGNQGGVCSVNWADTVGFDVFAIAPDPQVPPNKQCSDGQDNDGDGKIDLADPHCKDAQDDAESNQ